MLKNNKGTVLVIAVTAMIIMIVIGMVCLKIYETQSLLDVYEQARIRTFYAAEGAIEMMRGYIDVKTAEHLGTNGDVVDGDGYLSSVTPFKVSAGSIIGLLNPNNYDTVNWEPFGSNTTTLDPKKFLEKEFDASMYPSISVTVYLRKLTAVKDLTRVQTDLKVPFSIEHFCVVVGTVLQITDDTGYEIVATAKANYKTALANGDISTTLRYYFSTKRQNLGTPENPNMKYTKTFVAWRKD